MNRNSRPRATMVTPERETHLLSGEPQAFLFDIPMTQTMLKVVDFDASSTACRFSHLSRPANP